MKNGEPSGLKWEVVESLPVSEDIKRQTGDWKTHIANWKTSMRNLRNAGIEVICYNFMPILDWTRTDLAYRLPNGATCMRYDALDFAAFDLFLLERKGHRKIMTPRLSKLPASVSRRCRKHDDWNFPAMSCSVCPAPPNACRWTT